ncbi:SDR family oxidoreductase [Anaerolineales bacterium HSG6]|nr:SDR family oxidoreductase [Anaerolineales bacterium HSG6]
MTYSLRNKVALITGASRSIGIGAATARQMAQAGADIFITYYRAYDIETTALAGETHEINQLLTDLRDMGVRAEGLDLDLTVPSAPQKLFDRVESVLGSVDILVNNATHSENDTIDSLTADLIDKHYTMNLRGLMLLCQAFVKHRTAKETPTPTTQQQALQLAGGGRIINLTSGQGAGPMPNELCYAATKGAVEAFTVSLSAAVAPRGITVNAVDPGATDTGWIPPELRTQLDNQAPMGRVSLPEDAARLISFLASDEAGWITGQIIRSRGGL